jgi:oligopeptide transport system substrate-binding protein
MTHLAAKSISWLLAGLLAGPVLADNVFRAGHSGEPDSLDPHVATTGTAVTIVNDLFEGLLTLDAHGKAVPGIAARWDISEDGRVYTFALRPDLKWSDGQPLTARDMAFSLKRLADPNVARSMLASYVESITGGGPALRGEASPGDLGVVALDDSTLRIELTRPTAYFLRVLASPAFAPVPAHAIQQHGSAWTQPGNLVSNGAFRLAEWIPQDYVRLERNPYFRQASQVGLDGVTYHPLDDLNTGFRRFRAGELDAMVNFPPDKLDWIRANMPGALRLSPSLGLYVYVVNNQRPPLDDVRVRRALSLAVDRETITERLIRTGDKPAWGIIPPGIEDFPPPLPDPMGDAPMAARQAAARALLAEAGVASSLTITLLYHTSEEHKRVAVALASMWKAIGVNAELINAERQVVNATLRQGDFDLGRAAWFAGIDDAFGLLNYFLSDSPANVSRYSSPQFDRLVAQANQTMDSAARARLLRQAEQVVVRDQASIPIFYYVSRRLVSTRVRGWEDDNQSAIRSSRYLSFAAETD